MGSIKNLQKANVGWSCPQNSWNDAIIMHQTIKFLKKIPSLFSQSIILRKIRTYFAHWPGIPFSFHETSGFSDFKCWNKFPAGTGCLSRELSSLDLNQLNNKNTFIHWEITWAWRIYSVYSAYTGEVIRLCSHLWKKVLKLKKNVAGSISRIFYPILALCSWAGSLKQDMVFKFDFFGLLLFNIYAAEYLCCQSRRL